MVREMVRKPSASLCDSLSTARSSYCDIESAKSLGMLVAYSLCYLQRQAFQGSGRTVSSKCIQFWFAAIVSLELRSFVR